MSGTVTRSGNVLGPAQQQNAPQNAPQDQNINPNIIVQSSALDTQVPVVRRVNEADIKARFPHQHLTPIEGEPTFEQIQNAERELASNALTAKVSFGGGKKGCLGTVYSNVKFRVESGGTNWVVPASQGAYPTFPVNATNETKKKLIAKFLTSEYDIRVVETVEDLLKNQFVESIEEDFIFELKQGLSEYSGVSLLKLLEHVRKEYAPMDDIVTQKLMKRFREPPDMDAPIDKYYRKQEECLLLSQDSVDPITDNGMVLQLTTHMGESGIVNKSFTKFRNQTLPANKTWAKGKVWFRKALRELKNEAKLAGQDVSYQANNATFKNAHNDARDEIAGQMRDSFSSLAQAAVAKAATIDAHAATIASLTKIIADLTATNK